VFASIAELREHVLKAFSEFAQKKSARPVQPQPWAAASAGASQHSMSIARNIAAAVLR
jgi:hypothetical protein